MPESNRPNKEVIADADPSDDQLITLPAKVLTVPITFG